MAKSNRPGSKEILNEYYEVPRSKTPAYLAFTVGGVGLLLGLSLLGFGGTTRWVGWLMLVVGVAGLARGFVKYRDAAPILVFRPQGLEPAAWSKDMPLIPWKDIEKCEAYFCPGNNRCDYLAIDLYPDAKKKLLPSSKLRKKFEHVRDRYNVEYDILLDNTLFATPISDVVREAKLRIQAVSPHLKDL